MKESISEFEGALKSAIAGGAVAMTLPASWIKPTVSSVVLPGHAATSPGSEPVCDPNLISLIQSQDLSIRVFHEGDSNNANEAQINFERSIGTGGTLPTSVTLSGTGAIAGIEGSGLMEVGTNEGGAETSLFYNDGVNTPAGPIPSMATLEFVFPDQPAPCTVNVAVDAIGAVGI